MRAWSDAKISPTKPVIFIMPRPVASVLIGPMPEDVGLGEFLRARLGIDSRQIDLREVLAFDGEGPDPATQWRLFHHFGAALRNETKAL